MQYSQFKEASQRYEHEYKDRRRKVIAEHNQFIGDDEEKGQYYMDTTAGLLPKHHRELRDPALKCEDSSYRSGCLSYYTLALSIG